MLNVFESDSGDLVSNTTFLAVRKNYSFTSRDIKNTLQLRATIRNGGHVWPGGYPLFFVTKDGDAICFDCAKKEYKHFFIREEINACDINYEDDQLFCGHCNKQIEGAYTS